MINVLSMRSTSAFPLSIGTSLAFETLFSGVQPAYDPDRPIPEGVSVLEYSEIWINLATLFRNIAGATDPKMFLTIDDHEILAVLESEVNFIRSLMAKEGGGSLTPHFYFSTYKKASLGAHRTVTVRKEKTESQLVMASKLSNVMRMFFQRNLEQKILDSEIKPESMTTVALILTHSAYDLLSYKNFRKLTLIESHTGKIKDRHLWYTKYAKIGEEQMNTLPFTEKLIQVFGDSILFAPMDIRFRRMILETSRSRMWTPLTTEAKVLFDLNLDLKDRYLFETYRDL